MLVVMEIGEKGRWSAKPLACFIGAPALTLNMELVNYYYNHTTDDTRLS